MSEERQEIVSLFTLGFGSYQYDFHALDHYEDNGVYRQELVIYLK